MITVVEEILGQRRVVEFPSIALALPYVRSAHRYGRVVEWGGRG